MSTRSGKRVAIGTLQPFPNSMFYWGAPNPLTLTADQNADLMKTAENLGPIMQQQLRWSAPVPKAKQRALHDKNGLGINESAFLAHGTDILGYWVDVLTKVPPRHWVDKKKLVEHLSSSKPFELPSDSKPWKDARVWIEEAFRFGAKNGWADDLDFPLDPLDESLWEAVRILGDTDQGYGAFPRHLKAKMVNAGLAWILVDPKDRIVPYSWRHWVLKNKVPYSRFEDNMYIRRPPPPPPPVTPRTQPQAPVAISSAPAAVEKGSEALSTPIEYSNLLRKRKHISDEDDIIAKRGVPNGLSLVSPNVMATESLGKLKASTPRRGGGVDEEFKMMIKHGLFDGPIEGRIREIVEDSLKNGEIDTDIKLRNLIINTVRTSTADTKQVIQGLRKQVNSLEKKLETAMKNVQERDKLINDVTEGVASQRNELQQLKARLGLDAAPTSAPVSAPAPAPVTPGRHSSVAASVPAEISVSDSPIPIRYFGHSLQNRDVEEGICGNNRDARHADDDDDVVMMEAAPRNFWH